MLAILDGTVMPTPPRRASPPPTRACCAATASSRSSASTAAGRSRSTTTSTRMGGSAANLRLPIDLDAVRADVEALLERSAGAATPRCGSSVTRGGRRLAIVEPLKPLPDTLAAGHDRVRPDAHARRASSRSPTRAQHARRPPGAGARRRRGAARHAARPRARGPDDLVLLLARRRDARHAAARRPHPRLDHAPPPARARSTCAEQVRRARRPRRACARRSWPRRCARSTRSTRSTAPRCRRRPGALTAGGRERGSARTSSRSCGVSA